MNKNDLRYKTTEKLICDAYIKLSNESEDKKITVTDLVKEAQINRGTFYLHYQNVDDVCKDISDKFLTKCIEILSSDGELNLKKERIESILKYLKNNKNYVNFIIQDKFKTFIADSIVEYVTKEFVKKFSQILNFKEDEVKPVVIYMVYGSVALIVDWAKNDYEGSLSQIADALRITNGLAIKNFFLK
ncbi:MAG: TetR/AcrR family transcriptional regulator [Bacilli bacterium]